MRERGLGISTAGALRRLLLNRRLRPHIRRCAASIFYHFFFCQYRAALAGRLKMRGRIPVSQVDHELDALIPFVPGWVGVYLDFVGFWVRMLGFLLGRFGGKGRGAAADFLDSMGRLYAFAGEVYQRNLSTTRRPFYIRRPRFLLIHLADPHLMCIPSLHVMVAIHSYTRFARIMEELEGGDAGSSGASPLAAGFRRGALDITEAILYVKQHSVNCVAAAMYAMTRFDGAAFPPEEAERFGAELFAGDSARTATLPRIGPEAGERVREHILELYRRLCRQAGAGEDWARPLLDFLEPLRRGERRGPARRTAPPRP
ncbi:MAG: hypothetical protein LBH51_00090 [Treponema sp.]|jgi:hypothetical protein|nr:hypothetical protein [Treponema sp.]